MAAVLDPAALKPQFVGATHENLLDRRFSVAPMMDWTDRHCRMFHCALSKLALLWPLFGHLIQSLKSAHWTWNPTRIGAE
jgi:hypothetical protein